MISAHDVARELRFRLANAGDVKIHKLLYYCQGWHLARFGEPLFVEPVEAWANGPVIAELWRDEKHSNRPPPPAQKLGDRGSEIIELVVTRYGHLSGRELIRHTHEERPWRIVSDRDDPWDDQTIGETLLLEFFSALDDVYSFRPFRTTPERQKILDDAKSRSE